MSADVPTAHDGAHPGAPAFPPAPAAREPLRWGRIAALGLVVTALLLFVAGRLPQDHSSIESLAGSSSDAEELDAPQGDPEMMALLVAGERLQRSGKLDEALAVFEQIPQSAPDAAIKARVSQASTLLYQGQLVRCEQQLQRLEEIDPGNPHLVGLWKALYTAAGRRWDSLPYLREAITLDLPNKLTTLIYLANIHSMPAPDDDYLERVYKVQDAYGLLSTARVSASLGMHTHALDLLRRSLELRPDLIETYVQIAELLLDTRELDAFEAWQTGIPSEAESHPVHWLLRGRYAQEQGQVEAAIRCYWESLKRDPNQERACYQLGQLLASRDDVATAQAFLHRARRLSRLIEEATILYSQEGGQLSLERCARACLELGRLAEADAWCAALLESIPDHAGMLEVRRQIAAAGDGELPWLTEEGDIAKTVSFAHLPLPTYTLRSPGDAQPAATSQREPEFRFRDQAAEWGIDFQYYNGDDPEYEGRRMFEYTGGGVGVIDMDRDGWPDLHFTQGSAWPPDAAQREYLDHFYRNVGGQRFDEVAARARIVEGGFRQGISVGDLDNDGFEDLYVANLNGNRLFRNNGDGTFSDITQQSGIGHEYWTTSCLLADIDGDGLADLYDVTFLQGEDVFTAVCRGEDGVARSCAPKGFAAAPDFAWLSNGDGTFRAAAADAGFDVPDGDGLGIVLADFEKTGQLAMFIANDGRANFYFTPVNAEQGPVIRWEERALLTGLAYNDLGGAQACMGVGADDFDHDGYVDLFVTNFYQEANALYKSMGQAGFLDQTRSYGLHDASWQHLGFGTQFLDADLDSWPEIVVVNGHVDDFSHRDIPYRMRPQFFRNLEGQRFTEVEQQSLGPYFEREQLGRGLATLDHNRDGLPDFAVSNLDTPSALVTNSSVPRGESLKLKLVARTRSRDAIGTRVIVQRGTLTYEKQLTAGDGYQASNERSLLFGLGDGPEPVSLTIHWPGGTVQEFADLQIDHEYVAVEGDPQLYRQQLPENAVRDSPGN